MVGEGYCVASTAINDRGNLKLSAAEVELSYHEGSVDTRGQHQLFINVGTRIPPTQLGPITLLVKRAISSLLRRNGLDSLNRHPNHEPHASLTAPTSNRILTISWNTSPPVSPCPNPTLSGLCTGRKLLVNLTNKHLKSFPGG